MPNVIAWPPVGATGFENTVSRPISRSTSILTGRRYASSALRQRRVATVKVSGIGPDMAGAGYVEMLKQYLDGGVNLVRIALCSPVWYGALRGLDGRRGTQELLWSEGEADLDWFEGFVGLSWTAGQPVAGVSGIFDGVDVLNCTGLPANTVIAFPSETVRVTEAGGTVHTAKVVRVAKTNAIGEARIFVDSPLADGDVLIGYRESVVYEVLDPDGVRAVQPVVGNFSYTFNLREAFEDETDGFKEVDPWGVS